MNSLQDSQTPTALANTLRMRRSARNCLFVLVEGRDDRLALQRTINSSRCEIVACGGKTTIVEALDLLDGDMASPIPKLAVVALIDRDFQRESAAILSRNIVTTDYCDLEMDILLKAGLLQRYFEIYGDQNKIEKQLQNHRHSEFELAMVAEASIVGRIRHASETLGLGLKMRDFPIGEVVLEGVHVDREAAILLALRKSDRSGDLPCYFGLWREIDLAVLPDTVVCNGHDLVKLVAHTSGEWGTTRRTRRDIESYVIESVDTSVLNSLSWPAHLESLASSYGFDVWSES